LIVINEWKIVLCVFFFLLLLSRYCQLRRLNYWFHAHYHASVLALNWFVWTSEETDAMENISNIGIRKEKRMVSSRASELLRITRARNSVSQKHIVANRKASYFLSRVFFFFFFLLRTINHYYNDDNNKNNNDKKTKTLMYRRESCVVIVQVRLKNIIVVYWFENFLAIFVVNRVLMIIIFRIHWYVQ
jgi:hypothetical protein